MGRISSWMVVDAFFNVDSIKAMSLLSGKFMFFKIFRFIKYQYQRKTAKPDFYGVFSSFKEIEDQNPWNKEPWISGNVSKISRVKEGHFLSQKPGDVADQTHVIFPALIINSLFDATSQKINVLDFGGGYRI